MSSMRTLLAASLLIAGVVATSASAQAPVIPELMRAMAIDHYGSVEVMTDRTLPVPTVAPDEVLIAVHTAGVGPWDAEVRSGVIKEKTAHFPLVLGTDGSGTVVAIGSAVHTLYVGQAVYAYSWANPKGGFYAEYVAVPAKRVAPIPKNLSMEQAGALATTGLTAVQGIDDALHIQKGQLLIIHGAQGGVGTIALQLAKLRGARVLATASGADGVALVRRLGADVVVDGHSGDVVAAAKQFAPKGADVYGRLAEAKEAGHFEGKSQLKLELTDILINSRLQPILSGDYEVSGSSRGSNTAKKVGVGAIAGTVIGAIAGGGKGAAIGAGVGAGAGAAVQVMTKGEQVHVPSETLLDFRVEQSFTVEVR